MREFGICKDLIVFLLSLMDATLSEIAVFLFVLEEIAEAFCGREREHFSVDIFG